MTRPQTIQIFLPDGNPRSVRIAELTNRTIKAVLVPRNKLDFIAKREELNNVGTYFLFGTDEEKSKPLVYIGEAEDCLIRVKEHNRSKDFWTHMVAMINSKGDFTKSHVKFLENVSTERAKEVNRFEVLNGNTPTRSHVTESMEADLIDSFETMGVLLSALGYPIFDDIRKQSVEKKDILYLKGEDFGAEGDLIDDGFVVFKGSLLRAKTTPSYHQVHLDARNQLVESGGLVVNGDSFILQEDVVFNSPSRAAGMVMGRSANGWTEWKNKDGKTLDELKRQ